MKRYHVMNVFGVILLVMLVLVNLSHLLWTGWLIAEQIETGWGNGTKMEMLVLLPWLTELLCTPAMVAGVVYLILSCFIRHKNEILMADVVLFACAAVQFGLTNLFIWF